MRYKTHYAVECRMPSEEAWSRLTTFRIEQGPGDTEGAGSLRARDLAVREAQAWQRRYPPLADHLFRVTIV